MLKFKIRPSYFEWGGPNGDWWWFYWWNWLPKDLRYWGYGEDWYDGPIYHFGFWFFNWSWNYKFHHLFQLRMWR